MQSRSIANLVPKRYSFIPNSFILLQFFTEQFYSERFYCEASFISLQFYYTSVLFRGSTKILHLKYRAKKVTTPPKKRINSQSTSSKSPRKPIESPEKLAINASQNCVESP
uniref:Uncharacterized protein n=1 Tax=Caenorhabditis japonica TaxID=281687 RepID=A0A8R1E4D2_CAEJA